MADILPPAPEDRGAVSLLLRRWSWSAAAVMVVLASTGIPGYGQGRTFSIGPCGAGAPLQEPLAVPAATVRAADEIAPILYEMWQRSPTVRRQLARFALHGLVVNVRRCLRCPQSANGQTRLTIESGHVRHVDVEIQLYGKASPVETIAHEFEHILEHLDGVDLARLARYGDAGRGHGVHRDASDRYETERARQVGDVAAREYRAHARSVLHCGEEQP